MWEFVPCLDHPAAENLEAIGVRFGSEADIRRRGLLGSRSLLVNKKTQSNVTGFFVVLLNWSRLTNSAWRCHG